MTAQALQRITSRNCPDGTMDDADFNILRVIQTNPALSTNEVAKRVGLSHTPCWRRIKRLEAEGVIVDRVAVLDPHKFNLKYTVFAQIKFNHYDEKTRKAIEKVLQMCPQIVECFSMMDKVDYICRILVANIEDYDALLKKTLLTLPGLKSISSNVALKQIKLTTKLDV